MLTVAEATSSAPIIIVGAGQAGAQAATALRQEGYAGEIILFGDEPVLPYQRPPLSKQYLTGKVGGDQILLRAEPFYREKNITLRLGEQVVAIDCAAQTVTDQHGHPLRYSGLLLATGGWARRLQVPGVELPGIHYLRTLADADDMRPALEAGRRLLVVGGGYIGLEVAASASEAGLDVTVVEAEDRVLQRVTSPFMSDFYQQLHARHGVTIRTGATVTRFEGDTRLRHAIIGGTPYPCDLALIGIGIAPATELAHAAGIACDGGVLIDAQCRTSAPNVYAAGDCTHHMNEMLGRRVHVESVPNAIEQAKVAAANLAGRRSSHAAVPWFWSDQYGLKLQMAGFSTDADSHVVRGDPGDEAFAVFYMSGDRLVAVEAVNSPREFMAGRLFYGRRIHAAGLADPGVDLKSLLRDDCKH